jgi:hypothetical protein
MPEYSDYIEGLTNAGPITGDEIIGVSQSGNARKITLSDIGGFARWNFATSGASPGDFPTDLTKIYIADDSSVYPQNTWFASDGAGGWYTK